MANGLNNEDLTLRSAWLRSAWPALPQGTLEKGMLDDPQANHTHDPDKGVQTIERRAADHDTASDIDSTLVTEELVNELKEGHAKVKEGRAKLKTHEAERITPRQAHSAAVDNGKITVGVDDIEMKTNNGRIGSFSASLENFGKKAGLVGGILIGTAAAGSTYIETGSGAQAAKVAFKTAVPYGETALDLAKGDMGAAAHSATVETAATIGGLAGATAGAYAGATALASLGGVIGLAPGAAIGGAIGGIGGGIIGAIGGGAIIGSATDYTLKHGKQIIHSTMTGIKSAGSTIENAAANSAAYVSENLKKTWGQLTSTFNREATPASEINLNGQDVKHVLQGISEKQIAKMSPESQSLYEFRNHPAKFNEQFNELQHQGSLGLVAKDIGALQSAPVSEPRMENPPSMANTTGQSLGLVGAARTLTL